MSSEDHPNVEVLRRMFDAMANGDVETLIAMQTADFALTVSGTSAVSGTFPGPQAGEQFQTSMELTHGQMRIQPQQLLANDDVGVAFIVVTAQRPDGRSIEQRLIHEVRFEDGKIAGIDEWVWDQAADAEFWS
jgi:hypothetical protein